MLLNLLGLTLAFADIAPPPAPPPVPRCAVGAIYEAGLPPLSAWNAVLSIAGSDVGTWKFSIPSSIGPEQQYSGTGKARVDVPKPAPDAAVSLRLTDPDTGATRAVSGRWDAFSGDGITAPAGEAPLRIRAYIRCQ
jgi:hypothetical protein